MQSCKELMVAVYMITYNHEHYIETSIRSVLSQETNFNFKLFIGEDCSSDKTKEICIKYKSLYPNKIDLISREINVGVKKNAIETFNRCFHSSATYVALCEGDDYWTDPQKLQKQVNFLEANHDYTICFHKVMILNNNLEPDRNIEKRYDSIAKLPATINDLLKQGNFIHTPSVLFRNQLEGFPMEFSYSTVGDYFLYIMLSQKGYIKRLDDIMAVYRNNVGIYSTLSTTEMTKQMVIYNSCILSYLTKPEQKEILLKRQISIINSMNIEQVNKGLTIEKLSNRLSIKKLFKIILFKVKLKLFK